VEKSDNFPLFAVNHVAAPNWHDKLGKSLMPDTKEDDMAQHDACRRLLKGDDGNLDDDEIEVLVTAYAQNFKLASDKAWNFNATRDAKELQEKAKSTSDICAASLKKLHIGKCHDGKTKLFGEFADVGDKTALHEQYPDHIVIAQANDSTNKEKYSVSACCCVTSRLMVQLPKVSDIANFWFRNRQPRGMDDDDLNVHEWRADMVEYFGHVGARRRSYLPRKSDAVGTEKEETEASEGERNVANAANCGYVVKGIILSTAPTFTVDQTGNQVASRSISHYMAISLAKVDGEFVPLYNDGMQEDGKMCRARDCKDVKASSYVKQVRNRVV
jgi:hypothetical protein